MAIRLIPQQALQDKYPFGYSSPHIVAYGQFCNKMYSLLLRQGIEDVSDDEWQEAAINLTLYLEDVLADVGIWRAFTDTMQKMYGRLLPFYDIDEEDYYRDEPNPQDVQFIIWDSISRLRERRMLNPQNPMMEQIAQQAFDLMMDCFEKLPVNDSLKDFFAEARFVDDVYEMREVLQWLAFRCYLTDNGSAYDMLEAASENEDEEDDTDDMPETFYSCACMITCAWKGGPLALPAKDWLSAILLANGHEEAAGWVAAMVYRTPTAYLLRETVDDVYTLEAADGEMLRVPCKHLNYPPEEIPDAKVAFGSLISYRGKWYSNGFAVWFEDLDVFEEEKQREEEMSQICVPNYDKLIAKNGGSKLFYFKDLDAMIDFEEKVMGVPDTQAQRNHIPQERWFHNWTLFLPGADQPIQTIPGMAACIRDKRNPFYNQETAKRDAFGVTCGNGSDVALYLMENGLVPDAALNSVYGYEYGRQQMQDNMDFIIRTMFRENF